MSKVNNRSETLAKEDRPEGEAGNALPPKVDEDKGEVAVDTEAEDKPVISPTVEENKTGAAVSPMIVDEDEAVKGPEVDEDQETDNVSSVRSYEPGTDDLEPVESEGEIKFKVKVKDKGRTKSFSHLPPRGVSESSTARPTRPASYAQAVSGFSTAPSTRHVSEDQNDSLPSTAPSTRPVSEDQTNSAPSTAPTTRPVSQAQVGSQPNAAKSTSYTATGQSDSPAIAAHGDSGPFADQGDLGSKTDQGDSAPITDQGDPVAAVTQDGSSRPEAQDDSAFQAGQGGLPITNRRFEHDCGCMDVYDHTGKKRQQACDDHKLNPSRSVLPLPVKKPLTDSTNFLGGTRDLSNYTPRVQRNQESPPPPPPKEIPTKGRKFVQGSKDGPVFLDSFSSERAIEPTGPPNTLTTIPTKVPAQLRTKPRQTGEGSGGSRASQPQNLAAKGAPDLRSGVSKDEQRTVSTFAPTRKRRRRGEKRNKDKKAATEPKQGEKSATEPTQGEEAATEPTQGENPATKLTQGEKAATEPTQGEEPATEPRQGDSSGDEHRLIFTGRDKSPEALNVPAHRNENVRPKSILKTPVGTAAEVIQADRDNLMSGQAGKEEESEDPDNSGGVKILHAATLFKGAVRQLKTGTDTKAANNDDQGAVPLSRIVLGNPATTGPPVHNDDDDDSSDERWKVCPWKCGIM